MSGYLIPYGDRAVQVFPGSIPMPERAFYTWRHAVSLADWLARFHRQRYRVRGCLRTYIGEAAGWVWLVEPVEKEEN